MNKFSIRKILQMLFYIQNSPASTSSEKDDIMYLLKIIFFADRYHMRNYGITATGDSYYGMKRGPVASSTFDILQSRLPNNANSAEFQYINDVETTGEYTVSIKPQSDDELSPSVKEALDFSLGVFGSFSQFELSDITHIYPEWKNRKDSLNTNNKRFDISFEDFFEDPDDLKELNKYKLKKDPFEADLEFLDAMKEVYIDEASI